MSVQGRERLLIVGIFVVLILIVTVSAVIQARVETDRDLPALLATSSEPEGARALHLWLQALKRPVSIEVSETFTLSRQTAVVLMLEPNTGASEAEWEVIDDWVQQGGTLVLAGEGMLAVSGINRYDFHVSYPEIGAATALLVPAMPWGAPPMTASVTLPTPGYLEYEGTDPIVAGWSALGRPVVVAFDRGAGRVVLSSTAYPFSNQGLKTPGASDFVLNVLTLARRKGQIWFDEWHHGVRPEFVRQGGLEQWMTRTPAGRALLYGVVVLFVTLLLQGRAFGRPLPMPRQTARRAPLEYITAMANLSRRAGHRTSEAGYYRQCLKRALGRRYRLDPSMEDEEYVTLWADYNPQGDAAALRRLLRRLRQSKLSESELVQLAGEVARWVNNSN